MARTKGAKNIEPTSDARISIRIPKKLLDQLDAIALKHGQNRSESILEALRDYIKKE